MIESQRENIYEQVTIRAQEAFTSCLQGNLYHTQELLLRTRTELKRYSGDLPLVRHVQEEMDAASAPFMTTTFVEAEAWGWLEMASGVYQVMKERPGASLVHFKRAWRIWRPWSTQTQDSSQQLTAKHERVRAGLWLGEAWARMMSERASHAADAVLRAALSEIRRIDAHDLLQETLTQQSQLPPAPPGSSASLTSNQSAPYVCSLLGGDQSPNGTQ